MPNVFRISPELGPEDRFTAHLHYLLDSLSEIGQAWVDHLLGRAGKPSSRFVQAVDHPACSVEDRPDFRLECETVDILCEHKLGSRLGPEQLERYLTLPSSRPTYLALVSSGTVPVPPTVLQAASYLRPSQSTFAHFRWDELYPLVAGRSERLACDFADYMDELGLRPLSIVSWSDLFTNETRGREFGAQLELCRSHFRQLGAECRIDPTGLGITIQYPEPWLPLLYLSAEQRITPAPPLIRPPYLRASVSLRIEDPARVAFSHAEEMIELGQFRVLSRPVEKVRSPVRLVVRQYLTDLESILSTDAVVMRERLRDFTVRVFEHARSVWIDRLRP